MGHGAESRRFDRAVDALRLPPDPLARLDALRTTRERLEELEADAVLEARHAGATWKAIGALYGLSKQGAQQRFRSAAPATDQQESA